MELSEERLVPANGVELSYQEIGDPQGEPLILVMGLATQMLAWDDELCAMLAERGFRVVRFDNRDIGRSTKIESAGMPSRLDLLTGRNAAYRLRDMAADTFGLMDKLGIDSAHVVGASMGGMIAQTMAIERPPRVRSLVSMISTTGNRLVGMPTLKTLSILLGPPARGRREAIERTVRTYRVIGSPGYPFDEELLRDIAGRSYDRGHSLAGPTRQLHAIVASGDRTRALHRLRVPTTVIHGSKDPLVRPSGGLATARAIPGSHLRMFEGMGHDLPRALWPTFAEAIAANAARGVTEAVEAPTSTPSTGLAHQPA